MIDYDLLDDEFDSLPTREKVQRSTNPQGSLTDNVRKQKVVRDSTHKRLHEFQQKGY